MQEFDRLNIFRKGNGAAPPLITLSVNTALDPVQGCIILVLEHSECMLLYQVRYASRIGEWGRAGIENRYYYALIRILGQHLIYREVDRGYAHMTTIREVDMPIWWPYVRWICPYDGHTWGGYAHMTTICEVDMPIWPPYVRWICPYDDHIWGGYASMMAIWPNASQQYLVAIIEPF